jgi:hypothetical protein
MSSTDKKELREIIKALERIDLDSVGTGYQSPATQLEYAWRQLAMLQRNVAVSEALRYELSIRERPTIDIVRPWSTAKETNCSDINYAMKRARDLTLWYAESIYPKKVETPAYVLIFDKANQTWSRHEHEPITEKEISDKVKINAGHKAEAERRRAAEEMELYNKKEKIAAQEKTIRELTERITKQRQYIESLLKAVGGGQELL